MPLRRTRTKTLIYGWYEAVEGYLRGDETALATWLAPQFVDHVMGGGRESFLTMLQLIRHSFSEIHLAVNELAMDDEIITANLTFSAIHTRRFLSFPPTDRQIRVTHVEALQVEGNMVVERLWCLSDTLTLWRQLGAFDQRAERSTSSVDIASLKTLPAIPAVKPAPPVPPETTREIVKSPGSSS